MKGETEQSPLTLAEALKTVPEFRREHLREHELVAVLQIAVAAMLCGAKSQYAVAQWAKERLEDAPELLDWKTRRSCWRRWGASPAGVRAIPHFTGSSKDWMSKRSSES